MPTYRSLLAADPTLARHAATPDDRQALAAAASSLIGLYEAMCARYADRPCLGMRRDGERAFETVTYAALWQRVRAAGTALRRHAQIVPGERIGICGFASIDWVVADMAATYAGATSVPLQPSLPADALAHVIRETDLVCIACSAEDLPHVREVVRDCPRVRRVIVLDAADGGADEVTLAALERAAIAGGTEPPSVASDPARASFILYTSGSSGMPKGVVYREDRWIAFLLGSLRVGAPAITVGYLPLCHALGRGLVLYMTMLAGGLVQFTARRDLSTLLDDIRLARPTVLVLVPRVSALIYQHYKTQCVRAGAEPAKVREAMRSTFLGDRLCAIHTSGAPTAPAMLELLASCFDVPVMNQYGSTDLGPIAVDGRVYDSLELRLDDVPELGYHASDRPYPRGELLVRSPALRARYFQNHEANRAIATEDGFLRTGDIVELRGPRQIAVIDRRENILKLAHGEYVSTSRIEEMLVTDVAAISQVYVHAEPSEECVLAVVVPDREAVALSLGTAADDPGAVGQLLRRGIDHVARTRRLAPHEVPREIVVEPSPFTIENGLLTEAGKPRRSALRAAYGSRLRAIYDAIAERKQQVTRPSTGSTRDRVRDAVARTLGLDAAAISDHATLGSLGGDSLAAVSLATELQDALGVAVPVSELLGPLASVRTIAAAIDVPVDGRVTFQQLHARDATRIVASELTAARVVGDVSAAAAPSRTPPRRVLLTGATGFVGRNVLAELLEQGASVCCLVRARSDAEARVRLEQTLDPLLAARIARARGTVDVVAGDVASPGLGVTAQHYAALAEEIDAIVHAAALVNHTFSYAQLVPTNIGGTREIARLAVSRRTKSITFVSSVAALGGARTDTAVLETTPLGDIVPERPIGGGSGQIAVGYGTSKWAAELALADFHHRTGVPVTILRCAMLLPHRTHPDLNATDLFVRLLQGIRSTGLAPRSFYAGAPMHYDGVPISDAARIMAAVALAPAPALRTFHISNDHHDDRVSLDVIVDWLAAAGWQITRIADHAAWLHAFRQRLEALPPPERARSPIAVLQRWAHPEPARPLVLDTQQLRATLGNLGIPPAASLDEAYIAHVARLLS